jgi:hypothetical protein
MNKKKHLPRNFAQEILSLLYIPMVGLTLRSKKLLNSQSRKIFTDNR